MTAPQGTTDQAAMAIQTAHDALIAKASDCETRANLLEQRAEHDRHTGRKAQSLREAAALREQARIHLEAAEVQTTIKDENWRPVHDYEGLYEVSNFGRVRSLNRATTSGKILSQYRETGRLCVTLSRENVRRTRGVHQLVAEAFLGGRPGPNYVVAHEDGDSSNNKLSNLRWTTYCDNERDKRRHDRHAIGERNPSAKITQDDVDEIHRLRKQGLTQAEIAKRFPVGISQINGILNGKSWCPKGNAARRAAKQYPLHPGYQPSDTSKAAAKAASGTSKERQRAVMAVLSKGPATNTQIFLALADIDPDEAEAYFRLRTLERGLQPRASELASMGAVVDTGQRRKGPTGHSEIVWAVADQVRQERT